MLRFTMACALACQVYADVQLMQVSVLRRAGGDTAVQPDAVCHTAVVDDACYKKVEWAMQVGIAKYPEWFSPLTSSSPFEDVQRHLHGVPRFSSVCAEPCAARAPEEAPRVARLPGSCRTAVQGEPCYDKVQWAMQTGVSKYPQWFSPLTSSSTFEDFQRHLHGVPRFADVCAEPCAARAPEGCRTSVRGEQCYEEVLWVMQTGVVEFPDWYSPLNRSSPFEDFQRHLHNSARFSGVCAEPCAPGVLEEPAARLRPEEPARESCHTSVEGEACYGAVDFSMRHAQGYKHWDLNENSSFEDFQRRVHGLDPQLCPEPCSAGEEPAQLQARAAAEPAEEQRDESFPSTPHPTLPPGIPCTCLSPCAMFVVWDQDQDGCLEEAECSQVPAFVGRFLDLDSNGDGCVTQAECEENIGNFPPTPAFPPVPSPPCPSGEYVQYGTSVCQPCADGETRRRRATECSTCPDGKNHVESCDRCIGDIYLNAEADVGSNMVCVNTDTLVHEQHGQYVLTKSDTITIAPCECTSSGQWHRTVIEESYTQSNGTACFEIRDALPTGFDPNSPVTQSCSVTDGTYPSAVYPCGCGCEICGSGEACDESGNDGTGSCFPTGLSSTPAPTVSARGDPHLVNLAGEHFDVNHGGEFTMLRIPQVTSRPAELAIQASILPEHGKPCTTYITEVEFSGALLGGRVVQVRSYLRSHAENETDKFLGLRVLGQDASLEAPWERLSQWTDKPSVFLDDPSTGYRVTLLATQWQSRKSAGKDAPSTAGQVEIQVQIFGGEPAVFVARQDLPRQEHLNLAVRRLSQLGRADVGGLLGFDKHPESLEDVTPECQRHRDGLDQDRGPHSQKGWKTRWEKIKAQRGEAHDPDDNEATASLVGSRDMMCVCSNEDPSNGFRQDISADGLIDDAGMEGVVVEFQTGRLAEATWD